MKIVTIVGARPQFIKAAAVSRAIEAFNRRGPRRRIQEILVHTGQHYDDVMDRVFFEELEIPRPRHHLGVGSGPHGKQTARMMEGIESVLQKEKPDLVLVYGDTNSTLAGTLTAVKLNLPVAHVEAGLRSYNRVMPEETNRVLTDHLSRFLFCPTAVSVQNLVKEGIRNSRETVVRQVGDVMYDSMIYYSKIAEQKSSILKDLNLLPNAPHFALRHEPRGVHGSPEPHMVQGEFRTPNYYLATLHRAENTDNPEKLGSIVRALSRIGRKAVVVLPLHPRTRKMMKAYHLLPNVQGLMLIEPLSYLNMVKLMKHSKAVFTDSGGVQKEAYWLRVPCFTLREETEWVETVKSGWNVLVGTEEKRILSTVRTLDEEKGRRRSQALFGNGKASEEIIQTLIKRC
jgi:UDP-GlcNAc3NAcA epimerase